MDQKLYINDTLIEPGYENKSYFFVITDDSIKKYLKFCSDRYQIVRAIQ